MAYKKYIKRNGKLYGPYIYHSRRVNGKVISEYQGMTKRVDYKKFIFIFFGVVFVLAIGYGIFSNKLKLTGNVVELDSQEIPEITNLTVVYLHEINDTIHRYNLGLGVVYVGNSPLDYDWGISCGDFYVDEENVGGDYSGLENNIEWRTDGECADAVIKIKVASDEVTQEFVQPVFNSEEKMITKIVSEPSENLTKEDNETDVLTEEDKEEITEEETEIVPEEVQTLSEKIEIVHETLPLNDEERQMLINEFGNGSVIESRVSLFNGRFIVRYELGRWWVENSYDGNFGEAELKGRMEEDRNRWLRDIINNLLKESASVQELDGFQESYSI